MATSATCKGISLGLPPPVSCTIMSPRVLLVRTRIDSYEYRAVVYTRGLLAGVHVAAVLFIVYQLLPRK